MDVRHIPTGPTKVLIKWKDKPDWENSWEHAPSIQEAFTTFRIEDKVDLLLGY